MIVAAVLLSTLGLVVFAEEVIRRGFRDGDHALDVTVSAQSESEVDRERDRGRWVRVAMVNPSAATALVALGLRRSRLPEWAAPGAARRSGGRRACRTVSDRAVGAVTAGDTADFWLWWDGPGRRVLVLAAVGTPGRMRLHRVPVAAGRGVVVRADEVPTGASL